MLPIIHLCHPADSSLAGRRTIKDTIKDYFFRIVFLPYKSELVPAAFGGLSLGYVDLTLSLEHHTLTRDQMMAPQSIFFRRYASDYRCLSSANRGYTRGFLMHWFELAMDSLLSFNIVILLYKLYCNFSLMTKWTLRWPKHIYYAICYSEFRVGLLGAHLKCFFFFCFFFVCFFGVFFWPFYGNFSFEVLFLYTDYWSSAVLFVIVCFLSLSLLVPRGRLCFVFVVFLG